jgi:fucose permease
VKEAQKGRWAVAALFLINGFVMGSWAVEIPQLVMRFRVTKGTVGSLILVFGLGALIMMPVSGLLMAKFGSQRVVRFFAVATSVALIPLALVPNIPLLVPALFVLGAMIGGMNVAMNSNAVAVEKALSRAILSSSHSFWSVGVFVAGTIGGYAIKDFGFFAHIILVCAVGVVVIAGTCPSILKDDPVPRVETKQLMRLPRVPAIYLVGVVALFAMISETAIEDWSTLYLLQGLHAKTEAASLALAFFAGAMAVLRFMGDAVRNRFGAVLIMRISSLIAATCILIGALATTPWVAIFAFAFSGIGVANIVPIAFSAAGKQPGVAPSTGMSVVTTIGYLGVLLAPAPIGMIAERTGFPNVFIGLTVMLTMVFLLAPLVRSADFKANELESATILNTD